MNVIAELHITPIGTTSSLAPYIATCVNILKEAGLNPQTHAYGTNVEGEWDAVFAAFKACHEALHKQGVPRVSAAIKVGTRTDKPDSLGGRLTSLEAATAS